MTGPDPIRTAIREHIESGLVDPYEIAAKIAAALGEDDLRALAERMLPTLARTVIHEYRGSDRQPATVGNGKRAMGDATHDPATWPVCVDGEWRALGACTRDDVLVIAASYRSLAAANAAMADHYERLAALMRRHRAATVADLPAGKVAEVLT